jgi:hypothetical protein
MTKDELREKMLAFIGTQDGDYDDEWYASPRDFAAVILIDFAEYMGIEMVVPEYIPKLTRPEVNRNELLKSLMPEIERVFNVEFEKFKDKL